MTEPKVLILWTSPRSRSTMVERCFIARDDVHVLHEPLADSVYWGKERTSFRFSPEVCAAEYSHLQDVTFLSKWEEITTVPEGKNGTFSKDISNFAFLYPDHPETYPRLHDEPDDPTLLPGHLLLAPNVVHAFLIRSPRDTFASWHTLLRASTAEGRIFDPAQITIGPSRKLYDYIAGKTGVSPLVLDSDDLVNNPEQGLGLLCKAVGWEYQAKMLDWKGSEEKAKKLLSKFKVAHEMAEITDTILKLPAEASDSLPPDYLEGIAADMPDYLYLQERALKL